MRRWSGGRVSFERIGQCFVIAFARVAAAPAQADLAGWRMFVGKGHQAQAAGQCIGAASHFGKQRYAVSVQDHLDKGGQRGGGKGFAGFGQL